MSLLFIQKHTSLTTLTHLSQSPPSSSSCTGGCGGGGFGGGGGGGDGLGAGGTTGALGCTRRRTAGRRLCPSEVSLSAVPLGAIPILLGQSSTVSPPSSPSPLPSLAETMSRSACPDHRKCATPAASVTSVETVGREHAAVLRPSARVDSLTPACGSPRVSTTSTGRSKRRWDPSNTTSRLAPPEMERRKLFVSTRRSSRSQSSVGAPPATFSSNSDALGGSWMVDRRAGSESPPPSPPAVSIDTRASGTSTG